MTPAPKLKRCVAALVDAFVAFALHFVPMVGWVFGIVYYLVRDGMRIPGLNNRSVGKHVMGLKVVSVDGGQELTDWVDSLRRNIILIIPFAALVEFVLILVDKDSRRLGDRLAKSQVVPS